MVISNKPVFVMNESGNEAKLRYFNGVDKLDEELSFLDAYLVDFDSYEAVASCRARLKALIIKFCNPTTTVRAEANISDEQLLSIINGHSAPKALVERFTAYLRASREYAASCLQSGVSN